MAHQQHRKYQHVARSVKAHSMARGSIGIWHKRRYQYAHALSRISGGRGDV